MAGSDNTQTSTSSTGSSNPELNATISKLATGIANSYSPGASTYVAPGGNTVAGQAASVSAASNPLYSSAVNRGLGYAGSLVGGSGPSLTESALMKTALGNDFGTNDPGYAALRAKLGNDVMTQTNSAFNTSGLFGSDSNMRAAAEGLGNAYASLDYGNFQNDQQRQQQALAAIEQQRQQGTNNAFTAQQALPGLFSAGQLPASIQQSIGAAQDASASAAANAPTDYLAKLAGIINGTAGAAGTTTTSTQPGTPLWQTLLGGGIGLAGLL